LKPNILFLTIDALRADKCHSENKTSYTPNIDSLISKGVYCKQAIAAADQTGSSIASIFTSKFPITSGINQFNFSEEIETMIKYFKKSGYHTCSIVPEHDFFKSLTKNFDDFEIFNLKEKASWKRLNDGVGDNIIEKIKSINKKQPWFFYVHIMDIRPPFDFSEKFADEKFGDNNYDKLVSEIDVWLGKIFETVDLEKTLIVLSADHGENIPVTGEYIGGSSKTQRALRKSTKSVPFLDKIGLKAVMNIRFASQTYKKEILKRKLTPFQMRSFNSRGADTLYDETVNVPLIFSGYNINSNKIISELVRQIDIFPTLLDMAAINFEKENIDGQSIFPLLKEEKIKEIPAYIETGINLGLLLNKKPETLGKIIGIRTESYKYWRSRNDSKENIHLFNLKNDPNEENNIAEGNIAIINKMEEQLKKWSESNKTKRKLSDDEIEKAKDLLLKLGYI